MPNLVSCCVQGCVLNKKCGVSLTVPNLVLVLCARLCA